jgi:hypothetical protein
MSEDGLGQVRAASMLSLLTSGSTLVCCALPALLVALGAGAALSSLVTAVPQLVWFSEHKELVFGFASLMLLGAGMLQWRSRSLPCPLDPALAAACTATRRLSLRLYLVSVGIYLVGAFFAFVAPVLMA